VVGGAEFAGERGFRTFLIVIEYVNVKARCTPIKPANSPTGPAPVTSKVFGVQTWARRPMRSM
jgi:hypothetical protein